MGFLLLIIIGLPIYRPKAEVIYDSSLLKEKGPIPVWVFFTDKGFRDERKLGLALSLSRARDFEDLPLPDDYIGQIEALGAILRCRSRWLNGASFWCPPGLIPRIAELPFVHRIRKIEPMVVREPAYPTGPTGEPDSSYYGYTYLQIKMFNIDKVHALGVYGSGVRIGILDTGFKRRHSALNDVKIVSEYDFLSGDHLYRYRYGAGKEELYIDPFPMIRGLSGIKEGDTVELFFLSDSVYFNYWPTREIFEVFSTGGNLWSRPNNLSLTATDTAYTWGIGVAAADSIDLVWSIKGYYPHRYTLFHRRGKRGNWRDRVEIISSFHRLTDPKLAWGKQLFLSYLQSDSILFLRSCQDTWQPGSTLVYQANHRIRNRGIIAIGDTILLLTDSHHPDSIYLSISTDNGQTFTTDPIFTGREPVLKVKGDTLYLLFKREIDGLTDLCLSRSTDLGKNWSAPVTIVSSTSLGKIDLSPNPLPQITYESYGNIYLAQSPDWTPGPIDSGMVYHPTFIGSDLYYLRRGDTDTDYDPKTDRKDQPDHGTKMLGLIGGLASNLYIGVAFGADFLVAKTERVGKQGVTEDYEFPVEEDTWIEGLEWLERNGARVISSSLAYIDWYDYEDLDGKTAPISIAAHTAAKRGVVIVNAIGNRPGPDTIPPLPPYITAPGDAEGVITVGGVQPDSSYSRIAGFGPTVDGRMKPELCGLSQSWLEQQKGVVVVNPDSVAEYLFSGGTSTATAIVAGICALVLEGHPNWDADSLRLALFATASLADTPNDSLGYGLPDAYAALFYSPPDIDTITKTRFLPPFPNPFLPDQHRYIYFPFFISLQRARPTLSIYSLDGRLLYRKESDRLLYPGRYDQKDPNLPGACFRWDGVDQSGKEVGSGLYLAVIHDGFHSDRCKFAIVR